MNHQTLSAFIWSVADLLRGDYKQSDYGKVILPFTVLRRLDCVLEATKQAVLAEHAARTKAGLNSEPFLLKASGLGFYNTSDLDMRRLMGDQDHISQNLSAYIQAFSPAVRDIFERFNFYAQIDRLTKCGLLYQVAERFTQIDLHPKTICNGHMGQAFEELIRKFAELSNETAGEHFTPREVIRLMVNLLFVEDDDVLAIDAQLQDAIYGFERTTGVVATITNEEGSKSAHLAKALAGGKKIVVCTIQTFPFALEAVRELAATQGKKFAVIADEAHSSQTGEAAAKLKQVLTAQEFQELSDGGEVSTEDLLAAQMAARADHAGITYVAFTATPKAKTLELFGRRLDPDAPAGPGNLPEPFHVYSMRQAIEEGFILDVLRNYTPYRLAFKLANDGKELDEVEVERDAAMKGIMRWVRLHPYNISQRVQIVVEHFRENVAPLLDGQAKAMVVVGSRVEAVRWKLAIDKYILDHGYELGTLVAFSGEVTDKESGPEPFTETSKELNPTLRGRDIRGAFDTPDYHILLVANKFQTGFDQPLLCAMYVDWRLAGIRNGATTCWHLSSTCRMGVDNRAVVDPELRVHGLEGLRVVDVSVFPTMTSGNTNAPTMMVAEKGADLALGIKQAAP